MKKRSTMAINLIVGSPVTGEDFFGRKNELSNAEHLIWN